MNQFASYIFEHVIRLQWINIWNKVTTANTDNIPFFNPSILKYVYLCDSECMWIDFLSLKIQCKHVSIYLVCGMIYIYMCVRFFFSFHSIIHRFDSDTMRPWQTTYVYRMGVLDFIFSTDEASIFDNSHLTFFDKFHFFIVAIGICSCIPFKQINFVCMNCSI